MRTEFRREASDKIAKAVVAFSNTEGGSIFVGIDDDGTLIGVGDTDETSLRCSQILKDNVRPDIMMTSTIRLMCCEGKDIVRIDVKEGDEKPYYLREKGLRPESVYIRKGPSNIPVSDLAFRKMLQTNRARSYEMLESFDQNLSFDYAASIFKKKGLVFDKEHMRILGMLVGESHTNVGFMLSDQFTAYTKIALFEDESKGVFLDRIELTGSILEQYDGAMRFIAGHNPKKSIFDGVNRVDIRAYPEMAIREFVLNALIHRDYSMNGTILISIYPEKMVISSPGGLDEIYTVDDLILGVSSTRNPKLAGIFYRLGYVEAYGTGIPRAFNQYKDHDLPTIVAGNAVFQVTLPSMVHESDLESLCEPRYITRADLESEGMSRAVAIKRISELLDRGMIEKVGNGRSTRYRVLDRNLRF